MKKSIKNWFPIEEIRDGIIETKDKEYLKIVEVLPINFELKSSFEKESIIYQYKTFLKMCNFDMQILIQSKKNDLNDHIESILSIMKNEESKTLKELVNKYIKNVREKTIKTTITRRFFVIFCAEINGNKNISREIAIDDLKEKTLKIKRTLEKCGNEVIDLAECNFNIVNNLYQQLNRKTAEIQILRDDFYEQKKY